MFSFQAQEAYYRVVRRGGRWFVEHDGSVAGGFDSPQQAVEALARGQVVLEGLADAGRGVPADLGAWHRGDLLRTGAGRARAGPCGWRTTNSG